MTTRAIVVGSVLGVLLALSGVWFWSYMPDRDFLRLLGALADPEIAQNVDRVGLMISAIVFLFVFGVVVGVGVVVVGVGVVGVGVGVGGVGVGVGGVGVGVGVGGVLEEQFKFSTEEYVTSAFSSLIFMALTLTASWLLSNVIDLTTPPTRAEQIAQLQTFIAATATTAPVQTANAATAIAATRANVATADAEWTQLAILAATLNQVIPTPEASLSLEPTLTLAPNLLATQLAEVIASPPNSSPDEIDVDIWLNRFAAIAQISGIGIVGILIWIWNRRHKKP